MDQLPRALGVLLASILFAGCTTSPDAAPAGDLVHWFVLEGSEGATEPSLAYYAEADELFVVAPSGEALAWRVPVNSMVATALGPIGAVGSQDTDIAVAPDGSLWLATLWLRDPITGEATGSRCTSVARSTDQGRSWNSHDYACGRPVVDERPWIAVKDDGALLLHPCAFMVGACAERSSDNEVWSGGPSDLPTMEAGTRLLVQDDDFVYAHGGPREAGGAATDNLLLQKGPVFSRSPDGTAWTSKNVATDQLASWVSIGVNADRIALAWLAREGDELTVRQALSRDRGNTWAVTDLAKGGSFAHPTVTLAGAGPIVGWYEANEDEEWRFTIAANGTLSRTDRILHRGPLLTNCSDFGCQRAIGDFASAVNTRDDVAVFALTESTDDDSRIVLLRVGSSARAP